MDYDENSPCFFCIYWTVGAKKGRKMDAEFGNETRSCTMCTASGEIYELCAILQTNG